MVRRFRAGKPREPKTTTNVSKKTTAPKEKPKERGLTSSDVERIKKSAITTFDRGKAGEFVFFLSKEAQTDPEIRLKRQILIELIKRQRAGEIRPRALVQFERRDRESRLATLTPEERERAEILEGPGGDLVEDTFGKTNEQLRAEIEARQPRATAEDIPPRVFSLTTPRPEPGQIEQARTAQLLSPRRVGQVGAATVAIGAQQAGRAAAQPIRVRIPGVVGPGSDIEVDVAQFRGRLESGEFGATGRVGAIILPATLGDAALAQAGGAVAGRALQRVTKVTDLRRLDDTVRAVEVAVQKEGKDQSARLFTRGIAVLETRPPQLVEKGRAIDFALRRQRLEITTRKPIDRFFLFGTSKEGLKLTKDRGFDVAKGSVGLLKEGRVAREALEAEIRSARFSRGLEAAGTSQLRVVKDVGKGLTTQVNQARRQLAVSSSRELAASKNLNVRLVKSRVAGVTPQRLRLQRDSRKVFSVVVSNVRGAQGSAAFRLPAPPKVTLPQGSGARLLGKISAPGLRSAQLPSLVSQIRLPRPRATQRLRLSPISRRSRISGASGAVGGLRTATQTSFKQAQISNVFQVRGQRVLQRSQRFSRGSRQRLRGVGRARDVVASLKLARAVGQQRIQQAIRTQRTQRLRTLRRTTRRSSFASPRIAFRVLRAPRVTRTRTRVPRFSFDVSRGRGQTTRSSLFGVFVRRRGKFRQIGQTQSLSKALSLGRERVGTTLAATFAVKGPGAAKLPKLPGFRSTRTGQTGVFVERRGLRLSTGGEVRQIKRARRKKKKKR